MSLTKQYDVSAWIDRVGSLGTFDTFTGGGVNGEELKYHQGGMGPTLTLGGTTEIDNPVISRVYLLERDHAVIGRLLDMVNKVNMVITKQPLDAEGNIWGRPLIYIGTFRRCTPPEHDANAAADAATLELEMTAGYVGLG